MAAQVHPGVANCRLDAAQNKAFEMALAIHFHSPNRCTAIADTLGWPVEQIQRAIAQLEADITVAERQGAACMVSASQAKRPKPDPVAGGQADQRKGVPWSAEEHRLFLLGLSKFGKGSWRSISRQFVLTRTPTQVASHAQKYFLRLSSGRREKRRASIHDMHLDENISAQSCVPAH